MAEPGSIEVTGPDNRLHRFDVGTPMAVIQAQMAQRYPNEVAPATPGATPGGAPAPAITGPSLDNYGQMPPGTTVSPSMQPRPYAPDPNMPPLSEEAQRLQRLMAYRAFKGDEKGAGAANHLLQQDPTLKARSSFSDQMGRQAAELAKQQGAGVNLLAFMNQTEEKMRAWAEHNPSAFNAAIGAVNSDPYAQKLLGWAKPDAYELHRIMMHDIKAATLGMGMIPGAGSHGSNEADLRFEEAIGGARTAKSPEAFFAIWQAAKDAIRMKSGLQPEHAVPFRGMEDTDIDLIHSYLGQKRITPGSRYDPFRVTTQQELAQVPVGQYFVDPQHRLIYRVARPEDAANLRRGSYFMIPNGDILQRR